MSMTPAEKLSKKKPWRREPRNRANGRGIWKCNLREIREGLRLSIRDVADALEMSLSGYWQIEHGGDPMLTTARRIATFFGKTTDEIWP